MDERRKLNGYSLYDEPFGLGGIVMRTVTVEKVYLSFVTGAGSITIPPNLNT
ncbi:MAG TPA: hypothetical protein H9713_07660 [Candidatus Mediterraneibacter surreyensis]|nr:hypothetical protein [Candidatus Mediterraneibacter surreyensis]